jgi:hypothetical protein
MNEQGKFATRRASSRIGRHSVLVVLLALIAACEQPQQVRSYSDFMEDRIAREGTLARCNEDRDATLYDIECANARRAASAIALRRERERREALERESERKLADLRDQMARREQAARDAALAQAAAEREAYEAQWRDQNTAAGSASGPKGGLAGVTAAASPGDGLSLIEVPTVQRMAEPPPKPGPTLEEVQLPRPFRAID